MDIAALLISYGVGAHLSFSIIPMWDFFSKPHFIYSTSLFPFHLGRYLNLLPFIMFFWTLFLHLNDGYHPVRIQQTALIFRLTTKSGIFAGAVLVVFTLLFSGFKANVSFFILLFPLSWSLLLLNRVSMAYFIKFAQKRGRFLKYLLIVGTGERSLKAVNLIKGHPEWGIRLVGFITGDEKETERNPADENVLGRLEDFQSILKDRVVDSVLFTGRAENILQIRNLAYQCELRGIEFALNIASLIEKYTDIHLEVLEDISFIRFTGVYQNPQKLFLKRLIDIIGSSLLILFFIPFGLIIMLLIKRDSPGPVFYSHERMGKNGRRFTMYKFRSMIVNADKMQKELEDLNVMDGPVFKVADDPRITRFGKFLRKTSLDEAPQLYNVLKSDLSLVGPRPLPVRDYEGFEQSAHHRRFTVQPGVTCLWQVSGRNEIGFDEWVRLDLQYIENWSLTLDFKILLRTIPAVLSRKGAT